MKRTVWTNDEIETLNRLASEGYTASEAARVLNRPTTGVRHKAYSLGCPLRYENPVSVAKIAESKVCAGDRVQTRDTRSLTRFMLGDPPAGRSALDKKLKHTKAQNVRIDAGLIWLEFKGPVWVMAEARSLSPKLESAPANQLHLYRVEDNERIVWPGIGESIEIDAILAKFPGRSEQVRAA